MKGQTAMEYLMTYGWAIVVIVIVIGVLAYMFTQGQKFEYCNFSPVGTLNCDGNPVAYVVGSGTGDVLMTIKVRNSYQEAIHVKEVVCLNSKAQDYNVGFTQITSNNMINPGSSKAFERIPCKTLAGAEFKSSEKQKFSGQFVVKYRLDSDPTSITRTAYATVETVIATSTGNTPVTP